MTDQPVLTIFAGPNGSGKSTLKVTISAAGHDLGPFINADEIAAGLARAARESGVRIEQSAFEKQAFVDAGERRQEALERGATFSFETVFSHPSKLQFMKLTSAHGFFLRLLFVSTENAALNVARVKKRVAEGGHDVPEDKIVSRYARTMALLPQACLLADEAFLFDNSGSAMRLAASVAKGEDGRPAFRFVKPGPQAPMPDWVMAWTHGMSGLLKGGR